MKKLLILLLTLPLFSLGQYKVSGFVYDNTTGETLIGANIYGSKMGTATNGYGYFNFITDNNELRVSYVGYKIETIKVVSDTLVKVYLSLSGKLNEVVVSDKVEKRGELNSFEIKSSSIADLPSMLGDPDLFKSIQLLPGVSMGEDGSSNFYVRGGSRDQNLIMIDDVPIYSTTHSLGFFSAINNEVIKNAKLYKGAFPAKYGGRISSVLDIHTREGSTKQFSASASISPFVFQSTIDVPVIKNKSGLMMSFRHSTYDLISRPLMPGYPYLGFYDSNIKYHHKLGDKDIVFASFYMGKDVFRSELKYTDKTVENETIEENTYGNMLGSVRWNHIFNNRIFLNTTIAYNNYDFRYSNYMHSIGESIRSSQITSLDNRFGNVTDNFRIKSDFDYVFSNTHKFQFGSSIVYQRYKPYNSFEAQTADGNTVLSDYVTYSIYNINARVYLEDQMNFEKLSLNIGSNLSFTNTGNKNYLILEPRVSAIYTLSGNVKLSSTYSRMSQNMHLVTQSGPLMPEDIWFPSTDSIPPVISNQFTGGVNFKHKFVTIAVEAFYKQMSNLAEKRASYTAESALNLIEVGNGKSYGLETMLKLDFERIMFNVNYTYSRSFRTFENINFNKEFPFTYDRPHDLKTFAILKLSKKWKFSTVATYKSGNVTTVKQGWAQTGGGSHYTNQGFVITELHYRYTGYKNSYRLPDYFRWDVDLSYSYKGNWGKYVLKFGVYNVTNHFNAYKITVQGGKLISTNKMPIMPYISYSWKLR